MRNPVNKKTRQPVGIRTARIGLKPGAHLPISPPHTQTTTRFRHAAQAWTCRGLAWVLRPPRVVGRRGPQRGAVRGRRPVPMRWNPCRVRGSPARGSLDAPGKHSLRSASLGCMPQALRACPVTARCPPLPPFVIFVPFVVPDSTETAGSLPPPTAKAPAQRRPPLATSALSVSFVRDPPEPVLSGRCLLPKTPGLPFAILVFLCG